MDRNELNKRLPSLVDGIVRNVVDTHPHLQHLNRVYLPSRDAIIESIGLLRNSMDVIENTEGLRERMAEDGYLYLPGYLDRELVLSARESVTERLAAEGLTDPEYSADEAVAHPDSGLKFKPDLRRAFAGFADVDSDYFVVAT